MLPFQPTPADRPASTFGSLLAFVSIMIVSLSLFVVTALASAHALAPATDAGGPGAVRIDGVSEMLRGDYSPIDVAPGIAIGEVQSGPSVEAMLRGDLSPIAFGGV